MMVMAKLDVQNYAKLSRSGMASSSQELILCLGFQQPERLTPFGNVTRTSWLFT